MATFSTHQHPFTPSAVVTAQPIGHQSSRNTSLRVLPSLGSHLNLLSSATNIEALDLHQSSLAHARHALADTIMLIETLRTNAIRQNTLRSLRIHKDSEDCTCGDCSSREDFDELARPITLLPSISVFVTRTVVKHSHERSFRYALCPESNGQSDMGLEGNVMTSVGANIGLEARVKFATKN